MKLFQDRIANTQHLLSEENLDAIFITDNSNIFYLTGLSEFPPDERDCRILITRKKAFLFTDFRYTEAVTKKAPFISLIEISYNNSLIKALNNAITGHQLTSIGIEGSSLTVGELTALTSHFKSQNFKPVENYIEQLRTRKDEKEIASIQKACELTDKAFDFIVRHVKSGVTEKKVAWEIEKFIKENNGENAFPPIVAYGPNSAIPHHSPTDKKLSKKDEIVLLDFGAKVEGYSSDMTRTFFIQNPASAKSDAYTALLEVQKNAIAELGSYSRKGFLSSSLHKKVDTLLQKKGYPQVPHALGHGVGIDVHESPILSAYTESELYKKMIVTIEPGIYIPGNFGIRIEDTILLDGKAQPLTRSPKDLLVVSLTD